EVMARFLMLFESFWAPIEGQIDNLPLYFDPAFTPLKLLPWLASWVDLTLDDHWPEAKRRQLLRAAVSLYRSAAPSAACKSISKSILARRFRFPSTAPITSCWDPVHGWGLASRWAP